MACSRIYKSMIIVCPYFLLHVHFKGNELCSVRVAMGDIDSNYIHKIVAKKVCVK